MADIRRLAALALFALSSPAASQPVAEFYRGKTFTILVGIEQGTGFDLYGRVLSRHIGRHIPGNPTAIVVNMPGASGLVAYNWLANVAPKDGSLMGIGAFTIPFEPMFGNKRALFDASKMGWVGNMDSSVSVCAVRSDAGVATFGDLFGKEILVGGTGRAGPIGQSPLALKNLVGAKLNIVEGYKGTASVKLAVERGEVQGICGVSFSTIRTQWRQLMDAGKVRLVVQIGPKPMQHPMLANVPHIYDYAKTPEEKQVFDLIFGVQGLGRSFAMPAGVPPERLNALREAFAKAMADPELLAEAEKIDLDINPQSGSDVQEFVERVHAFKPEIIARAKKALEKD